MVPTSETFSFCEESSPLETFIFFFKKLALLLTSLLKVYGSFFFLPLGVKAAFPLVSKEKEKLPLRVKVKEKAGDLLANV